MATFRAMTTTMLIFLLHVAPSWGQPTMDAGDKATLMAVRAAIENKEKFPTIQCHSKYYDPVLCDSSGRVTKVKLSYRGLKGKIAPEIGNLSKLKALYIIVNELSGSIPSSIGNLKSLQTLALYSNQLNGSIPSSIGNLKSLQYLDLYGNQLSGSIPSSIGTMPSLQYLYLFNNQLSGKIPSSIGTLASLQYISLQGNQLVGNIPSSTNNFKSLVFFYVSNNYLTGPIVQVNGYPHCYEINANCLFGSSLPKGCPSSDQRSKSDCLSFCNATQVGGPCGGNGICSISKDGKTRVCACNRGYTDKPSKYTCKLIVPPTPRSSLSLRSPPRSPPPLPRSQTRRPPLTHPPPPRRLPHSPSSMQP